MLDIAQERVPQGDFRLGDIEALPYDDHQFDVVTGLNAFQYAANPVEALKEARRVARKGAPVVVQIWGRDEDCQATVYFKAIGALQPPPPPGTPGPVALSKDGALETLIRQAGLTPVEMQDVDIPWDFPDLDTTLRSILSAGPSQKAILAAGEDRVRAAVAVAFEPFKTASGGYHLDNKFRFLIATA